MPFRLDKSAASNLMHSLPKVVVREVVEHHRMRARRQHRFNLVEPVDLNLDVHGVRKAAERCAQPAGELSVLKSFQGRKMVVLCKHGS